MRPPRATRRNNPLNVARLQPAKRQSTAYDRRDYDGYGDEDD